MEIEAQSVVYSQSLELLGVSGPSQPGSKERSGDTVLMEFCYLGWPWGHRWSFIFAAAPSAGQLCV